MALLFMDSFDHYGGNGSFVTKKWDAFGNNLGLTATSRTGTHAIILYASDNLTKVIAPPGDVFIVGFALRMPVLGTTNNLIEFREGSTIHVAISIDASGFIVIKRGTTTLATATTHVIAANSWFYVEIKVVIHDTTGSVTVHVDGIAPTFSGAVTGIDTRNGGTGNVDRILMNGSVSSPFSFVDDLYVCDDSGSVNNDFLGICAIERLLPSTATPGTHQDFTPSTGTDHGALVDEAGPNDDTDYNSSATTGHQDSYNYPSLALTGSILGIQTNLYARKTDAGVRDVATIVRAGGTTYVGATVSPLTTYKYFPEMREVNPNTGVAWTSADIAALEVGIKVVT